MERLRQTFDDLAEQWRQHCHSMAMVSSIAPYLDHPSYRKLVELGWPVVPFILANYRKKCQNKTPGDFRWWNFLLQDITGIKRIDPQPDSFDAHEEDNFWLGLWNGVRPA